MMLSTREGIEEYKALQEIYHFRSSETSAGYVSPMSDVDYKRSVPLMVTKKIKKTKETNRILKLRNCI